MVPLVYEARSAGVLALQSPRFTQRERPTDIPLLATYFARGCAERLSKTLEDFTPAALDRLVDYEWPGNIRELQNIVERAVLLTWAA